jgi:parallel beta-helix repeat protein
MSPFRNNLLWLVFLLLLGSLSFAIDISSCWQVNASGSYDLTQNVSGTIPVSDVYQITQACIIISSPNVNFDCNGYNITNNATADASGILINGTSTGYTNVTIENCPVSGFERSIYLHNTTEDVVRNVTVDDSYYGIMLRYSTHNHLYNISMYNLSNRGLILSNSEYNNITNISIHNMSYYGIEYAISIGSSSNYNNITNATLSDNPAYGVSMLNSQHNQLRGSTIHHNRGGVRLVTGGHNNTVADTAIYKNTEYGAFVSTSENNFTDNTIHNNTGCGIEHAFAHHLTIFNNSIYNNSGYGVSFSDSSYTVIIGSDIFDNGQVESGVWGEDSNYSTIANNTLYNNSGAGLSFFHVYNNTLSNNTAYGNGDSGIGMTYADYSNISDNTAYLNGEKGFWIVSSDLNVSGNTAYANTEEGFYIGSYAYNSTIRNNIAHNNTLDGIYMTNSPECNLTGNTAADNGGSGIYLANSPECNLTGNTAADNGELGIYLANGDRVSLSNSVSYSNNDTGIRLSSADNSSVVNVTSYGNQGYGIRIGSGDCNLTNSTVYRNAGGVYLNGGYCNILDNTIYDESTYGIYLNMADYNVVANNTVYNVTYGIYPELSLYGDYLGNTIHNTTCGMHIIVTWSSEIADNVIYDGDYGIYLDGFMGMYYCDDLLIRNNTIYEHTYYGIFSNLSTATTFANNTFYSNEYALRLLGTNYTMEACSFLSSSGAFSSYANLSMEDNTNTSEEYSINWSAAPSTSPTGKTSFEDKFINITTHAGTVSIDSISWFWDGSEASGHDESTFELWVYNSSGDWSLLNDTPDTTSNVIMQYDTNPASIYGLFETPSTGESGGSDSDFECFTSSGCPDCYICRDHECTLPKDSCASASDCSGDSPFYYCSECACTGYECNEDEDCEAGYSCRNGECIPPECLVDGDCEHLGEGHGCVDYECTPPECLNNSDCEPFGAGYYCLNYECIPPECFGDADCPEGKMCENYNCVPWGCRSNADCNDGFYCDDGICMRESIPGGPGGSSGGSSGGSGTPSGQGGEAEVPSEDGEPETAQVQQAFPFLEGDSSGGIIPDIVFSEETRVSSGWVILFLLVLVAAVYFLHRKKRERREEE